MLDLTTKEFVEKLVSEGRVKGVVSIETTTVTFSLDGETETTSNNYETTSENFHDTSVEVVEETAEDVVTDSEPNTEEEPEVGHEIVEVVDPYDPVRIAELKAVIKAENLNKDEVEIPSQLKGNPRLLIVAFQQWHQRVVDSWVPFLSELTKEFPSFDFYELPTIRKMNYLYRRFIDGGMRAGIPSKETRRRTVTLYIEKEPFKDALGITSEETIYLFLINSEGSVLWQSDSEISREKALSLRDAIEQTLNLQ